MGEKVFEEVMQVLHSHGRKKIIGAISLTCLVLLVTLVSTLLGGEPVLPILGIFYAAIFFFIKLLKLGNPLFTTWSKLWPFIHYGIIAATLITIIPLTKKAYVAGTKSTNRSEE